jgi:hypothetical protein
VALSRRRIQRVPSRLRSEERALGRRERIRALPSRQRIQQMPRRLRGGERALGRRERIRALPSRRRIQQTPRRSRSGERALCRRERGVRLASGRPIKREWAANARRSMAETPHGRRVPEPRRSNLRRGPVVLRTQKGTSKRRIKIRITDLLASPGLIGTYACTPSLETDVCFTPKADIDRAHSNVRFVPKEVLTARIPV